MSSIWRQLETAHRECDVLEHPFYQRWSLGRLERGELAAYAGQYVHAVRALAYFTVHAHRDEAHAVQVRDLVEPRISGADGRRLLTAANRAWRGNWMLLDGVERLGAGTT